MRINGNDKKVILLLYGDTKYFQKDVHALYIYMLKMFHVYIISIDCTLLSDISCGYYITPKKQEPCSDYLVLEFLVFL